MLLFTNRLDIIVGNQLASQRATQPIVIKGLVGNIKRGADKMGHGGSQGGRSPHAGRKKEDATSLHEQKKASKKTGVTHSNVVELRGTKVTYKQAMETLRAEKDRSQKYLDPGYGCKVTMTASLKRKAITDGRNRTTR
jgi:hypothetical protein